VLSRICGEERFQDRHDRIDEFVLMPGFEKMLIDIEISKLPSGACPDDLAGTVPFRSFAVQIVVRNSTVSTIFGCRGRTRDGALFIREVADGSVFDTRKFSRAEFRSDWSFAPLPRLAIDYSAEATDSRADLRYNRAERFQDFIAAGFDRPADNSLLAHAAPEEWTYAFSGAARRRWASFEAELGVRVDGQRYEGFASRQQWSPRLNLRYDMAERWHLYGSWGHFTQAQRPEEWRVEGTQSVPDLPELAIHSTLGIAYERSAQTRFGLEAYRKRWTHVSPYYDNTLESLTLVPDLTPDRMLLAPTHSESAGIELSARRAFPARSPRVTLRERARP